MKCFPIDIIILSLAITSNACMQIRIILFGTILDVSSFWKSHSFIHSSSDYCHICIDMHMNVFKWKSFCFTLNNEYYCARIHKLPGLLSGSFFLPFQQPHMPSFIIISPVETTANGMNAKLVIEHRRRLEWFANAKNDMSFRNYN